jgi:hypothetical protein
MKGKRAFFVFLAVAACSLMRGGTLHGHSEGYSEGSSGGYSGDLDEEKAVKVKAAYLLNFTKFVTWPAGAFQDDRSPIVVCIVGSDPFGPILDQTIKDKKVSGREIKIQRLPWRAGGGVSAMKQCHVLYVSRSLGDETGDLIVALARMPVLLIGEGAEFAKQGGALGFILEEGKIVFWANKKATDAAGLQLSSQLLKLARPVEGAVAQNSESSEGQKGD